MGTADEVLKALPVAIQAFGLLGSAIAQIRASSGYTDEQLLESARNRDAATLAAVQAHLAKIKADEAAGK